MKRILIAAACALSLSAYALPTYEPFTEYSAAATATGTNAIDLATGGFTAPSGESWGSLNFSGTSGTNGHGIDINVTNMASGSPFTTTALSAILPGTFPGFPTGSAISTFVVNPEQPFFYPSANFVGNSAVLKFAQDITRPTSGTKTFYVSYLMVVAQQGQLGTGNDGRYLAFLSSSNLAEGTASGGAYTSWASLFNTFNGGIATGVHYAGHGLIGNNASSCFIGPCDSAAGKTFAGTPFTATYTNGVSFVVGAYIFNAGGKDTNAIWVNPSTGSFGGATPPASPIFATNINFTNSSFQMSDIGGLAFIDRVGSGASGGVGTNYVANLILGSTWSYVTGGPEFTNQPPASTSVNLSQNVSISGAATAAGQSVTYQWQKVVGGVTNNVNNGTGGAGGPALVSGATTGTLTLMGFGGGDVGTYQLAATASGTGFSLSSSPAALLLADPQITANPASATVNYGGTATFTATVSTAAAPIKFQWYNGSTPIANGLQPDGSTATSASGTTSAGSSFTLTLTLSGVSTLENGSYTLFATNVNNFENSSAAATLTVNDPYISTQPTNPVVVAGGNATFTVVGGGSPTVSYQWFENGIALSDGSPTATGAAVVSGSLSSTLTLTDVQDADDGSYSCTITSGSSLSTNSAAATLTVQDALVLFVPPKSLNERVGDHTAFSIAVLGGGPSYQWKFGSTPIPGATGSGLTLTNIQLSSNGTYSVTVSNLVTAPQTYSATLNVINSTILNLLPNNLVVSRVGDGAQTLSAVTGNTIYLDQYTTGGGYVNTIQIPDEGTGQPYGTGSSSSATMPPGSPALVAVGAGPDAGYEVMLTLSSINKEYLGFAGYCEAYPFLGANVNIGATAGVYWRGLATVNAFGVYNLAYTNSGLYSGGGMAIHNMATLEGTNFWTTGEAGSGTIKYVNSTVTSYATGNGIPGSSAASSSPGGGRVIKIVNGPLPPAGFSSVSNLVYSETGLGVNNGLYAASGGGAPEPGPSGTFTAVPLLFTGGGQPGDFAFSPDNLTVYVADSGQYTGSGSPGTGGIERYDSDGSGWEYSYTLAALPTEISDLTVTNGAQGLTADFSANATWGSGVTGAILYATSYGTTTNSLVRIVDNGDPSTTPASFTVLATAGANQGLRGVRFGPAAIPPAIATAPLNQTNFPGNTVSFTASASGSAPLFYQWYFGNTLLAGATQTSFTTNNISLASGGNYSVVVSNLTTITATNTAVLTVTPGAPTITPTALPNYTETVGDHVGWAPFVSGTVPMTYGWHVTGNPNPIQTGTISAIGVGGGLSLANIQTTDSGTYTLFVTNQFGTTNTTSGGVLTVTTAHQALSPANLVVSRVGDGVQPLSAATGNTLYLDQYTTGGGYVNTIQVPDEGTGQAYGTGGASSASMPFGSPALLVAGAGADAPYEGLLTLAPNGQSLNFAGYCEPYPFSGPDLTVGAGAGPNWRGIGGVDAYGYYTLFWTNTGLYSGGNHQVHGAVDVDGNGTNFYSTGEAGSGFGVKYLNTDFQPASGSGIASVAGSFPGTRVAKIVSGNLVFSDAGANPVGIYGCSGLPTTTSGANLLIAETNSPLDFSVSPDGSTVYIADNGAFTGTGNPVGGIQRWDGFAPSSYTYSYTLATGTGSAVGARALTVDYSANATWGTGVTGAKLYVTTAEASGNRLIKITDNGATSGATTLVTASANQTRSGVRFGPTIVPPGYADQPQDTNALAGTAATFTAVAIGSGPLTYQWYFQANGVGAFNAILNATNANYTIGSVGSGNVGKYHVIVTNPGGLTSQSQDASLSLATPPQFTSETFLGVGVGFQMNYIGTAGVGYSIWTSPDATLAPVQSTWTLLTTGTFSGGTDSFTDPNGGTNPNQFYIISVP